jgi:hypothetical protein
MLTCKILTWAGLHLSPLDRRGKAREKTEKRQKAFAINDMAPAKAAAGAAAAPRQQDSTKAGLLESIFNKAQAAFPEANVVARLQVKKKENNTRRFSRL